MIRLGRTSEIIFGMDSNESSADMAVFQRLLILLLALNGRGIWVFWFALPLGFGGVGVGC
jgi:hypothetical protein